MFWFVLGVFVGGLLSICYVMGKEIWILIIDSVWGKILKSWLCIIYVIFWYISIKVCFSEFDINKFVIFGVFRFRVGLIWYEDVGRNGIYVVLGNWSVIFNRDGIFYLWLEKF